MFRRRALALSFCVAATTLMSCSLASGEGAASGSLNVRGCWEGEFNLNPDFFSSLPYRENTLMFRIQNGSDYENFADGVSIVVNQSDNIRKKFLGQPLLVGISPEITPPGVPLVPEPSPAIVQATLGLGRSCHTQNVVLYALSRVRLGPNGECSDAAGLPPDTCGVKPTREGSSTMTFTSLFTGDVAAADAQERLNEGSFDLYLADPREVCSDGSGSPPPCRGHITGNFRFFHQRGRPAQPFP